MPRSTWSKHLYMSSDTALRCDELVKTSSTCRACIHALSTAEAPLKVPAMAGSAQLASQLRRSLRRMLAHLR
eukprot:15437806-Alexandrium_andersonii.AAC.1